MVGMSRADLERLFSTNAILLPYDMSETGAKWRQGFLLDGETIIGPLEAADEGTHIVANVARKGGWDAFIIRTRRLNECSFASKLDPPNEDAAALKIGSPENYLNGPVIIASHSEIAERTISRAGILTGLFTDSGETYLDISIRALPGDIGGFVLAPDGNLLGIVCNSTLTSKDGSSIAALSAPDICKLAKRRKLMPEACAKLLGAPAPSSQTPVPSSRKAVSSWPVDRICRLALSTNERNQWDGRDFLQYSVTEAKRRELTPEACTKLLGRQAIQVKEAPPKEENIEDRLTKLKNLDDKGLVTKEEHETKQAEILEDLFIGLPWELLWFVP
jgi:hypothetical protein